jgi:hypothetical protein
MNDLQRTVDLAVQKMRLLKLKLQEVNEEHNALLAEHAKLDQREKERQDRLKIELRRMVVCIHKADLSFVVKDEDLLSREKEIRFRMQSIETGMGNMHLFVKTTLNQTKQKTLVVDGKHIYFDTPRREYINPFSFVYQETDEVESPGEKNFQLYLKDLLNDLEVHKSYAAIAYGPSGTGKTTMIQRVVQELYKLFSMPPIDVYQVYVRSPIRQEIPETQGNVVTELLEGGTRHERFDLRNVDDNVDVVKVFLNDVQMIESVGTQMYGHGRTLYRMLAKMLESTVSIKRKTKFFDEDQYVSKYVSKTCPLDKRGEMILQVGRIRQLFNDQHYIYLDGFTTMIEEEWIKPIQQTVELLNKTRSTLHTLITNRFGKEEAFFTNASPTVEEEAYFIKSGGFIPLHWLRYMDPLYAEPILFFKDIVPLIQSNSVSKAFYVTGDGANTQELTYYFDQYFLFFTPETANLYFRPDGTSDTELQELRLVVSTSKNVILEDQDLQDSTARAAVKERNDTILDAREKLGSFARVKYEALTKYTTAVLNIRERVNTSESLDPETQHFQFVSEKDYDITKTTKFIDDVQRFSFQRSTPQNQQSSRCATVYVLHMNEKTVTFIDLPGNEDQMTGCESDKDDNVLCTETLGIRVLLKYVREVMTVKRLNVLPSEVGLKYPSKSFADIFEPLMQSTCKVGFLCFAANYAASPNYTENTRTTLHYMAGLKTASYSCEGENEQLAKDLIAAYAGQDAEEKAKRLHLFPETQEALHKPVKSATISDDYPVDKFYIPYSNMLPGKNKVDQRKRATCFFYYSVRDHKQHRIEYPECFLYLFTCSGILDFDNGINAIRFTDVKKVDFVLIELVNVHSRKTKKFEHKPTNLPWFKVSLPSWDDIQDGESYSIAEFSPTYPILGQRRMTELKLVNKDGSYNHERGFVELPADNKNKLSFKPSLISIDFIFFDESGTVIITPNKYRSKLKKFETGTETGDYMRYEIKYHE